MSEVMLLLKLKRKSGVLAAAVAAVHKAGLTFQSQQSRELDGSPGLLLKTETSNVPDYETIVAHLEAVSGVDSVAEILVDGQPLLPVTVEPDNIFADELDGATDPVDFSAGDADSPWSMDEPAADEPQIQTADVESKLELELEPEPEPETAVEIDDEPAPGVSLESPDDLSPVESGERDDSFLDEEDAPAAIEPVADEEDELDPDWPIPEIQDVEFQNENENDNESENDQEESLAETSRAEADDDLDLIADDGLEPDQEHDRDENQAKDSTENKPSPDQRAENTNPDGTPSREMTRAMRRRWRRFR